MQYLLVDDTQASLFILERLVEKISDSSIHVAKDGLEAVAAYEEILKDFPAEKITVLMDINMPNLNGIEAIKRIREIETNQKILKSKIIVVSAYDEERAAYLSKMVGANGFLPKPIEMQTLSKVLVDN